MHRMPRLPGRHLRGRGPLLSFLAACGSAALTLGACGPSEPLEAADPVGLSQNRAALQAEVAAALPRVAGAQWQGSIAMARAGDIYLVVWEEHDLQPPEQTPYGPSATTPDIRGARVRASDGAVLDNPSLCIACGAGAQSKPTVASNGSDFLVAWNHVPPGFNRNPGNAIRSVRVRGSDGAVLGSPLSHTQDDLRQGTPAVASDGSNYLLTWDGTGQHCFFPIPGIPMRICSFRYGIYGTRVGADGTTGANSLLTPNHYPAQENFLPGAPRVRVSHGGGNYLVVFSGGPQEFSSTWGVYGARVSAAGALLDPQARAISAQGNSPAVAFDGSQFLTVWSTQAGAIRGARVSAAGTVLDPSGFSVSEAGAVSPPDVAFDGSDYRVVWGQQGAEPMRRLWGARVTKGGSVASDSRAVLAELQNGERPAIAAAAPGRFLVGYRLNHGAWTRLVEDLPNGAVCTQDASCQSDFCVDGVCCESVCGGGVGTDCQACSVTAGGTADGVCGAVRAEAAVVCRPSAVACDVAEVCDGASTVCPGDEPPASEPDLSGDKCEDAPCDVAAYVAALGPETLAQPFGQSLQAKADAACQSWEQGNAKATQGQLRALLNEVRAQGGKKLSPSVADTLSAALEGMLALALP